MTAKNNYYYNKLTIKDKNNTKDIRLKDNLTNDNKLWTTVKDMTDSCNKTPPRNIDHDNIPVTTLRQIANIANRNYIDKIDKVRKDFKRQRLTHIDVLKMIVPKPTITFKLPYITLDQTIRLIHDMKTSNSLGYDLASIKVYKMLAYRLGPHIQHLINTIIKTGTYPDILQLSKITPQKKPDKPTNKIDSYQPINNLCTLDKIIEQYIKTH